VSKGRPEKKREEGRTKAFRKKKRAPPLLVVQKEQKQPRPHEIQKRKKKSGCLPHKRKRLLVWIAFLRIALLIHSFPERHNITIYFESGAS
jgi:hypothetical protein